ncbi:unnamed protein product [Amoebophrya sp. A120]|nr:unnamed protein product [Amoebophrya sp. A120]|eukprot:GSA120T00008290001.1
MSTSLTSEEIVKNTASAMEAVCKMYQKHRKNLYVDELNKKKLTGLTPERIPQKELSEHEFLKSLEQIRRCCADVVKLKDSNRNDAEEAINYFSTSGVLTELVWMLDHSDFSMTLQGDARSKDVATLRDRVKVLERRARRLKQPPPSDDFIWTDPLRDRESEGTRASSSVVDPRSHGNSSFQLPKSTATSMSQRTSGTTSKRRSGAATSKRDSSTKKASTVEGDQNAAEHQRQSLSSTTKRQSSTTSKKSTSEEKDGENATRQSDKKSENQGTEEQEATRRSSSAKMKESSRGSEGGKKSRHSSENVYPASAERSGSQAGDQNASTGERTSDVVHRSAAEEQQVALSNAILSNQLETHSEGAHSHQTVSASESERDHSNKKKLLQRQNTNTTAKDGADHKHHRLKHLHSKEFVRIRHSQLHSGLSSMHSGILEDDNDNANDNDDHTQNSTSSPAKKKSKSVENDKKHHHQEKQHSNQTERPMAGNADQHSVKQHQIMQDHVTHAAMNIGFRPSRSSEKRASEGPRDSVKGFAIVNKATDEILEIHATRQDADFAFDKKAFLNGVKKADNTYGPASNKAERDSVAAGLVAATSRTSNVEDDDRLKQFEIKEIWCKMDQMKQHVKSMIEDSKAAEQKGGKPGLTSAHQQLRKQRSDARIFDKTPKSSKTRSLNPDVDGSEPESNVSSASYTDEDGAKQRGLWFDHWRDAEEPVYEDMIRKTLWNMGFHIGDANIRQRPMEQARTSAGEHIDNVLEDMFADMM